MIDNFRCQFWIAIGVLDPQALSFWNDANPQAIAKGAHDATPLWRRVIASLEFKIVNDSKRKSLRLHEISSGLKVTCSKSSIL